MFIIVFAVLEVTVMRQFKAVLEVSRMNDFFLLFCLMSVS